MKNLVLVGMKGSGKSYLSEEIARRFHLRLISMDEEILRLYAGEHGENLSHREIVHKHGEPFFRDLEMRAVQKLQLENPQNTVIDSGGGIVLKEQNRKILKSLGTVVWIKVDPEINYERIMSKGVPGFFPYPDDPKRSFTVLWQERVPLYEALANYVLEVARESRKETFEKFLTTVPLPQICLVIGDPITQSRSPLIHNKAYEILGIQDKFTFQAQRVTPEELPAFMHSLRGSMIRGVSCTVPHKEEVVRYLDSVDDATKKIGAVNTIVHEKDRLRGYNTDWMGVVGSLEKISPVKGKRVLIIGAGGAARAAMFGLNGAGARITVVNRTQEKARLLAREFQATFADWNSVKPEEVDIIINTTSVGMIPKIEESPAPAAFFLPRHIVFDVVYNPYETRLLRDAKKKGATILHGTEMFLIQAAEQFRLYTGLNMPVEKVRDVLLDSSMT